MTERINNVDMSLENTLCLFRIKIVVVGDVSVGKTSIINQIMNNKFKEDYEPSIGVDFFSKSLKYKEKNIKLQIWDSAGQEKFRSLIPNYIHGASIIFLIYDMTKKESFESLTNYWIQFINENEKTSLVLVANKSDLNNKRVISNNQAQELADKNNMLLFEVSAKSGEGIKKMLYSSVLDLQYFDKYHDELEKMVSEMEIENNGGDNNSSRTNISILEQSKGNLKFSRIDTHPLEEDQEKKKTSSNKTKKCSC